MNQLAESGAISIYKNSFCSISYLSDLCDLCGEFFPSGICHD